MHFTPNHFLLLAIFVGMNVTSSLYSIGGFDRIYNPHNGVTIDLVYDTHLRNMHLNSEQMHSGDISVIEACLDPSEINFMQTLRNIHSHSQQASVDLIWEQGYDTNGVDQFMAFSDRLVKEQFKNLSFIPSDFTRHAFVELIKMPIRSGQSRLNASFLWCSFEKPMDLPDERIAGILDKSGDKAFTEFNELYTLVINQLKAHLHEDYLTDVCARTDTFELGSMIEIAALTDVEMLSHILSSSKKHIIVFAGSWHANNLCKFLVERLDCKLIERFLFPHMRGKDPINNLKRIELPLDAHAPLRALRIQKKKYKTLLDWFADTYQSAH